MGLKELRLKKGDNEDPIANGRRMIRYVYNSGFNSGVDSVIEKVAKSALEYIEENRREEFLDLLYEVQGDLFQNDDLLVELESL